MRKALYILTILILANINHQELKAIDCNLQQENSLWKIEFENTNSKSKQIELIKQKIKSDSIYSKYYNGLTVHSEASSNKYIDKNKNDCGCKIQFVLYYSKKKYIILDLNSRPDLSPIIQNINTNNVVEIISLLDKNKAQEIYGSLGECGVVVIKIIDSKLKRKIKNMW